MHLQSFEKGYHDLHFKPTSIVFYYTKETEQHMNTAMYLALILNIFLKNIGSASISDIYIFNLFKKSFHIFL